MTTDSTVKSARKTSGEVEVPPALAALNNQSLGAYHLKLAEVTSRGYVEQVNFSLYLADQQGQRATPPVFSGIYSRGRPAAWIVGWIDGLYCSPVQFDNGTEIDLAETELARPLLTHLGNLIPPNGRLMIAYEAFHLKIPLLAQTRRALGLGVPPLVTPIGELLYYADCWLRVRDWYIPEGGREGHCKLQGNKALDAAHRQKRAIETIEQLRSFLDQTGNATDELIQAARQRSEMIIAGLLPYTQAA